MAIKFHAFDKVFILVDHSPAKILEGTITAPHPKNQYKDNLPHLLKWYVEFPQEWYSGYYYQDEIYPTLDELLEGLKERVTYYDNSDRQTI